MKLNINDKTVFNIFLFLFFGLLLIMSFDYNPRARMLPIGFAGIGLVMIFVQILYDAVPAMRHKLTFLAEKELFLSAADIAKLHKDNSVTEEKEKKEEKSWGRVFKIFVWLTGFVILLKFAGYLIAVPVFLFSLIKLEGHKKTLNAFLVSIGTVIFLYVLFEVVLQSHF